MPSQAIPHAGSRNRTTGGLNVSLPALKGKGQVGQGQIGMTFLAVQRECEDVFASWKFDVAAAIPEVSSGVLGFRDGAPMRTLLARWHEMYRLYEANACGSQLHQDQKPFRVVLNEAAAGRPPFAQPETKVTMRLMYTEAAFAQYRPLEHPYNCRSPQKDVNASLQEGADASSQKGRGEAGAANSTLRNRTLPVGPDVRKNEPKTCAQPQLSHCSILHGEALALRSFVRAHPLPTTAGAAGADHESRSHAARAQGLSTRRRC